MNMIEKVARAICIASEQNPDNDYDYGVGTLLGWQIYLNQAIAAVEAMMFPNGGMLDAGYEAIKHDCGAGLVYTRMVEMALNDQEEVLY